MTEDAETPKQEMTEGARAEDDWFLLLDSAVALRPKTAAEDAERKWSLSPWDQQEVVAQQPESIVEDDWFLQLEVAPRGTLHLPLGSSTSLLHLALSLSCIFCLLYALPSKSIHK